MADPVHFLVRLLPPRPSFPEDMTASETDIMQRHVAYWTGLMQKGVVLLFGPVADPQGAWGVGIVRVGDLAEAEGLREGDPALQANIGFRCELLPMPRVVTPA